MPRLTSFPLLVLMASSAAIAPWAVAQEAPATVASASGRTALTAGSQVYTLDPTPSAMLSWPLERWLPLAANVESDLLRDLDRAGVESQAFRRDRYMWLALIAQLRGDWQRVPALVERARRLHDEPAARMTAGLVNQLMAEQQLGRHNEAWLRRATRDRFAALPWAVVGPTVQRLQQQLQAMDGEVLRARVAAQVDEVAKGTQGRATLALTMQLIGARLQLAHALPHRDALVQGLSEVIAQHPVAKAKP